LAGNLQYLISSMLTQECNLPYQDIAANELESFLKQKAPVVIDMRDPAAQATGLLPNAQSANDALVSALAKRRRHAPPVLVYCYHGNTSRDLCAFLTQFGLPEVYNLSGGWAAWEAHQATSALADINEKLTGTNR
jgi:thiosulfate sulfurtransferase